MRFAHASAVSAEGDGRYVGAIHPGWDIAGAANGGYLLTLVGRAMLTHSRRRAPVSLTVHYLRPGRPGRVTCDVRVVREGRSTSTCSAVLRAADGEAEDLVAALGTFGPAPDAEGLTRLAIAPPALPDVAECVPVVATDTFPPPFMDQVELRLHPDDAGFLTGRPSGDPTVRGWFRLRDDEPLDALAVALATDAFPPTAFAAGLPVAWVPTIDLTVHLRGTPAPGWLRCSTVTRAVVGGLLEVDGEVWDAHGRLVAQSRQLARLPRGGPDPSG